MKTTDDYRKSKRRLEELDRKIKDAEWADEMGKKINGYAPYLAVIFMFVLFIMYMLK